MAKGTYRGKIIYLHYTDRDGAIAIYNARRITDAHRGYLREGSKAGIYVNPPGQVFNPENVENLLFLGNEKYQGRGDYVLIFTADNRQEDLGAVTSGSWVNEYKIYGDVDFMSQAADILYIGPNPFPDYFAGDK